MQLFDLQVDYAVMLSLNWIPTVANGVAEAIPRPSRDSIIRLKPDAFRALWDALGPFNLDLMALTESAQRGPGSTGTLTFFSQYDYEGSSGVDVLSPCLRTSLEFPARGNPPPGTVFRHQSWPVTCYSIWRSATRTR